MACDGALYDLKLKLKGSDTSEMINFTFLSDFILYEDLFYIQLFDKLFCLSFSIFYGNNTCIINDDLHLW